MNTNAHTHDFTGHALLQRGRYVLNHRIRKDNIEALVGERKPAGIRGQRRDLIRDGILVVSGSIMVDAQANHPQIFPAGILFRLFDAIFILFPGQRLAKMRAARPIFSTCSLRSEPH